MGAPAGADPLAERPNLVVVGLGNPGARYDGTRHNAGFAVADRLAARLGAAWAPAGAAGIVAAGEWDGRRIAVVKPQAFMNRSGAAVADVLARTDLGADALLVVTDDLALPVGTLRMRARGGAGGHNGLADIADALGHADWPRLRVGVGAEFTPGSQVDYVLAPFGPDEAETAAAALDRAAEAALAVATDGLAVAMSRFNGRG
ncbi:MAG TPA: aminoacyl-tRNA hydrolase [Rubricoccaceae bacterium]